MPENNLFTQLLPISTILLCIGLVVVLKLISHMKSKAVGNKNSSISLNITAAGQSGKENPERVESDYPALVMRSKGVMKSTLREISLAGAFLACPLPRPIGEKFSIKICMEDREPLELNAEVIWNNGYIPASDIVTRGMKVRFLRLADKDRRFISDLISPS